MIPSKTTLHCILAAGITVPALLLGPSLSAAALYWDTNGTATGSGVADGIWGTSNFWNSDSTGGAGGFFTPTTTSLDDVFISPGSTGTGGTITVSGTQSANSITFQDPAGVTISGGTSITLGGGGGANSGVYQTGSGADVISTAITLGGSTSSFSFSNTGAGVLTLGSITGAASSGSQTLNINAGSTGGITLNGVIANGAAGGNVALLVNSTGSGITTLTAANTYSGGTTISAGTLQVGNGGSTGSLGSGSIVNNGTLAYNFSSSTTVSLPSANISGSGNISATAGVIQLNGNITVGGSQTYTQIGGGTLYTGIELVAANTTLTGSSITLSGDVGKRNSAGNSLTLDTSAANGTINLNISFGRNAVWYAPSGFTANAGTGTINITGTGPASTGWRTTPVSLTGAVNITANVDSAAGVTINSTAPGLVSGVFSDTMSLTKQGPSTLVLTGVNTYTGATTINGGTLQISADSNLGAAPGSATANSLTISGGAKLSITANGVTINSNRGITLGSGAAEIDTPNASQTTTINSIIAGPGSLTFAGAGDVSLNGANTYTGGTSINSGRIRAGGGSIFGTGPVTVAAGAEVYATAAMTFSNNFTIAGFGGNSVDPVQRGAFRLDSGSTINGAITLAANAGIDVNSGTGTINGVISGAYNLTLNKAGTGDGGTLILNAANTYSGATIGGGTIRVGNSDSALGAGMVTIAGSTTLGTTNGGGARTLPNAVTTSSGTTLSLDGGFAQITLNGNISGPGALSVASTGLVVLGGSNTYTGATTAGNGYLWFASPASLSSSSPLTLSGSGSLVAAGAQSTVGGWLTSGYVPTTANGNIAIIGNSSENINFGGLGYNSLGLSTPNTAIYSGTITPGSNGYLFAGTTGNLTIASSLGGSVGLTKNGTSVLTLAGANNYTGATSITNGIAVVNGSLANTGGLTVSGTGALYLTTGSITGGAINIAGGSGAALITNSVNAIGAAGSAINITSNNAANGLVYTGAGETTDRVVNYQSASAGGTITNNGTGLLIFSNPATTTATAAFGVFLGGIGSGSYVGTTQPAVNRLINLNKQGTGTWTLTGLNNLDGGTFSANGGVLAFASTATTASGSAAATITNTTGKGGVLKIASGASVITSTVNTNGILGGWAIFNGTTWAVTNGNTTAITGLSTFTTDWSTATGNADITASNTSNGLTINSLRFNTNSGGTLTQTLSGANVISSGGILETSNVSTTNVVITGGTSLAAGVANGDLIVNQINLNGTLAINSVIAANGTGGLTKAGPGTLILGGANTYSGTTFVDEGILNLGVGGSTGAIRGNLTIGQGAKTVVGVADGLGNASGSRVGAIAINGGTLDVENTGNNSATSVGITMTGGTITGMAGSKFDFRNDGAGDTTLTTNAAGSTAIVNVPSVGTPGGNLTVTTAFGLTPSGVDLEIDSNISNAATTTGGAGTGTHALTKAGPGTLLLTGTDTYTGPTSVTAGTLIVSGSISGTTSVALINNSTLSGVGTINPTGTTAANNITVATGGMIAPGTPSTIGTLTLSHQGSSVATLLSLARGAQFTFKLSNSGNDSLMISNGLDGGKDIAFNNDSVNFTDLTHGLLSPGQYLLIGDSASTGYTGLALDSNNNITSGLTIAPGFLTTYGGSTLQEINGNIVLNLVPEPTAAVSLLGGAGILLGLRRRRR